MQCPHEGHGDFREEFTGRGVVIERCATCGGVWLDRGELFQLTRRRRRVRRDLMEALQRRAPGFKISPAKGTPMKLNGQVNSPSAAAASPVWFICVLTYCYSVYFRTKLRTVPIFRAACAAGPPAAAAHRVRAGSRFARPRAPRGSPGLRSTRPGRSPRTRGRPASGRGGRGSGFADGAGGG